jgi:hypothetical protein
MISKIAEIWLYLDSSGKSPLRSFRPL